MWRTSRCRSGRAGAARPRPRTSPPRRRPQPRPPPCARPRGRGTPAPERTAEITPTNLWNTCARGRGRAETRRVPAARLPRAPAEGLRRHSLLSGLRQSLRSGRSPVRAAAWSACRAAAPAARPGRAAPAHQASIAPALSRDRIQPRAWPGAARLHRRLGRHHAKAPCPRLAQRAAVQGVDAGLSRDDDQAAAEAGAAPGHARGSTRSRPRAGAPPAWRCMRHASSVRPEQTRARSTARSRITWSPPLRPPLFAGPQGRGARA